MYGLQLTQDAWIVLDHTVFCPGAPPDPGIPSPCLHAWLVAALCLTNLGISDQTKFNADLLVATEGQSRVCNVYHK